MAYDATKPFSYGIPDGTYVGKPTTASCFEKDGRLMLDVNFAVKDPDTGKWYMKDNGFQWEAKKRHWLTGKDGAFNEATIKGIKEWAKGWNPQTFDDLYWFQSPDANGTPFGNLAAIGEVELNFTTDSQGSQSLWVHDPNRPKGAGRKAFVPDGANTDRATLAAKWGSRAKALFSATPKTVKAAPAPTPTRPAAASAPRPAVQETKPTAAPWADYPQTCDGAFAYFCARLGEPYSGAKHDEKWFELFDKAAQGKDPDLFAPEDVRRLFETIHDASDIPF